MPANYVLLERIELNASASSVTFSNIPQTGYTDLKLVISARGDRTSTTEGLLLSFNGSSSNFSTKLLGGAGSGTPFSASYSRGYTGDVDAASSTASTFGSAEIYIPNYTSSNYKSFSTDVVSEQNGTTAYAEMFAGLWSNGSAITSITVATDTASQTWAQYSTFSLYGVAALGTTPAIAPKADGGNVVATDGTYWYHAFLSNGTFTPQTNLTCDYVVVAGGGGGGYGSAGGGGAGGLLASSFNLINTNYAVTIGAGGAGAVASTATGINGNNSSVSSITSTGGGGGGSNGTPDDGASGGSGGGGSGNGSTIGYGGAASPTGQGNAGGNADNTYAAYAGGGGGGAGSAGAPSTNTAAGAGGNGVNTYSSWATATGTGASGYYAGGGGGGSRSYTAGAGGAGGGGAGVNSYSSPGGTGVVNTGGGGGGGGVTPGTGSGAGGAGGSGIIIIRYPVAS